MSARTARRRGGKAATGDGNRATSGVGTTNRDAEEDEENRENGASPSLRAGKELENGKGKGKGTDGKGNTEGEGKGGMVGKNGENVRNEEDDEEEEKNEEDESVGAIGSDLEEGGPLVVKLEKKTRRMAKRTGVGIRKEKEIEKEKEKIKEEVADEKADKDGKEDGTWDEGADGVENQKVVKVETPRKKSRQKKMTRGLRELLGDRSKWERREESALNRKSVVVKTKVRTSLTLTTHTSSPRLAKKERPSGRSAVSKAGGASAKRKRKVEKEEEEEDHEEKEEEEDDEEGNRTAKDEEDGSDGAAEKHKGKRRRQERREEEGEEEEERDAKEDEEKRVINEEEGSTSAEVATEAAPAGEKKPVVKRKAKRKRLSSGDRKALGEAARFMSRQVSPASTLARGRTSPLAARGSPKARDEPESKQKKARVAKRVKKERKRSESESEDSSSESRTERSRPSGSRKAITKKNGVTKKSRSDSEEEEKGTTATTAQDEENNDWRSDAYDHIAAIRCHAKDDNPDDNSTRVHATAFHPLQAEIVATAGGSSVCLIDCEELKLLLKYNHPDTAGTEDFYALAWTVLPTEPEPSPILAAAGRLGDIKLIDEKRKLLYGLIEGHRVSKQRVINCLAFSPTNPRWLLSASEDGTIRLWDIGLPSGPDHVAKHRCLAMFVEAPIAHEHLSFAPNGHEFFSSSKTGLHRWKLDKEYPTTGEPEVVSSTRIYNAAEYFQRSPPDSVAWFDQNLLAVKLYEAHQIAVLDVSKQKRRLVTILHWPAFDAQAHYYLRFGQMTDKKRLVVGTGDGRVFVYDLNAVRELARQGKTFDEKGLYKPLPPVHELTQESSGEKVWQAVASRDGRFVVGCTSDDLVLVWKRREREAATPM